MSLPSQHAMLGVVFAYLAVCPRATVTAADEMSSGDAKMNVLMRVECVRSGDLRAKMHAKNQSMASRGWRVLFGFYVKQSAWRKHVNTQWSRVASVDTWENTVREGMRLASEHSHNDRVYVNASAQSSPASPLLSALQLFSERAHESTELSATFWHLILSSYPLSRIVPKLDALTRSLSACAEKTPLNVAASSLSAWGLSGAQL